MCGIAGFLDTPGSAHLELKEMALQMARAVRHRGPDDEGVWADPFEGIALGHERLAIVDLSVEGHQPMHSASGRYVVSFNGEIYNHRSLRTELDGFGHRFRGHSDTEVMLSAIDRWGLDRSLPRFNGMFAFALWDRDQRVLHLVRDRIGEKPLYYGLAGDSLLFGSELKALRAHPSFDAGIDREALALFFQYKFIPAPHTIYQGIRKLLPGTVLSVRAGRKGNLPEPSPYWTAQQAVEAALVEPFTGTAAEAANELERLLLDAVRLRMEADVPLGAFLSGGVDSSTVVALMQTQSNRPVRTFTIGFDDHTYDESGNARSVATLLGTDHTDLYLSPQEAMDVVPRLPVLYDEPFADSSQIPTLLVSSMARREVAVSLSGDGGDELFAGYNRYLWAQRVWSRTRWAPKLVRRTGARMLSAISPASWEAVMRLPGGLLPRSLRQRSPGDKLHKLAGILAADGQDQMYRRLVSHWTDPTSLVLGAGPTSDIAAPGLEPPMNDFTLRMMYRDLVTYLPDDILAKVDRASMAVSLEVRVPFLDHRVVEFAWRLPLSFKVRGGRSKWVLRQVLHRHVPDTLIDRPKMGFGVPIYSWLRGPMRDWVETLLDGHRLRQEGYLDPAPIRAKWAEHLSGTRNWQYHLWDVLMFQAWLEAARTSFGRMVDRPPAELPYSISTT
jgi:asparagine synthase (glutamine-hydrolysing)